MKRLFLLLTMIGILTSTHSQSTLLWSKDFPIGLHNYYSPGPSIYAIAETIKVIGIKNTTNGPRLLIVNYDLLGDTISTKTFGGDSVININIIDYKFDTKNQVYILLQEYLDHYKSKIVLQKYSLDGSLIWVTQIHDPADTSYTPRAIGLANDTCIFITAFKQYDLPKPGDDPPYATTTLLQLYAYSSNGNQLWQREFNRNTEINGFNHDLFIHNNTSFFFANNMNYRNVLVKVDINNILTINTNTSVPNVLNNIQLTPDTNLLITAATGYRIIKANLNGMVIWTKDYGTNLPSNVTGDEIKATIQDSAGNIYVTGRHYGKNYGTPNYTNADILTIKYNSNGNLIWQNRYEYGVNNADIGNAIVLKNGQIYVGGQSQRLGLGRDYDYVILKMDSASSIFKGEYRYDGIANKDDVVYSLTVFDNGNVALTGLSYINSKYDWTTQLLSDIILSVQNTSSKNILQVYPNPIQTNGVLTIIEKGIKSYSIISSLGNVVQQGLLETKDFHTIQIENLTTGMYLLKLQANKEIRTSKIIVK